jgi:hypothetical protein
VYLKNRLFHKALHKTPYKEWMGVKPSLDDLRTRGALVTALKPVKTPAKADRHTAHGFYLALVSCQSMPSH